MNWDREAFWKRVNYHLNRQGQAQPEESSYPPLFRAVSESLMDLLMEDWQQTEAEYRKGGYKKAYYFSMEFLIGRVLGNNLLNLSLYKEIGELLAEKGIDLNTLEESEPEPGLGNGGLGRLAACFLDSMTAENIPGMGYGIRYRYGIFQQKLEHGRQMEYPDNWLKDPYPWSVARRERSRLVKFGGQWNGESEGDGLRHTEDVLAIPYDMPITGYGSRRINTLRLWEAESPDGFDFQLFNQEKYQEAVMSANNAAHISRVLYPSDNGKQGKILRLKQEYFFSSASLQDILHDFKAQYGCQFELLPDKAVIQLNDTHPVVAIPELMRLLMDVEGLTWERAWNICSRCMAYTNHTILGEALEKWPVDIFRPLLPRIYSIIEEINHRFLAEVKETLSNGAAQLPQYSIIENGQVRMAWLAIASCFSVNGVAWLHTEILKKDVLKHWYKLYPQKFNNKTNGVTQRRWLLKCNPRLARFISDKIGDQWIRDLSRLEQLKPLAEDPAVLEELARIKEQNKEDLAAYIRAEYQISLNPQSIYDVQIKRLHEYKRQLLNVLHIISLYHQLKANPQQDFQKRSFIFGAKAAPGYHMAKLIIELILAVARRVNNDPETMDQMKVVFLENYSVSMAERLFPASDISEQISTAGKEASGTGNMKFMMNGALTMGTLDGANIEIAQEAGRENCFIFGMTSEEVSHLQVQGDYRPSQWVDKNKDLQQVMSSLVDGTFGEKGQFQDIYNSLLSGNHPDTYYVLRDFPSYKEAQAEASNRYRDRLGWQKMALLNIASSGKFSSDRTIRDYAREIWKIDPQ